MARLPAKRRGSVFFNPGDPGAAGLPGARTSEGDVGPSVQRMYDLVTWDPRGIGRSRPGLVCLSAEATAQAEEKPDAVLTDPRCRPA